MIIYYLNKKTRTYHIEGYCCYQSKDHARYISLEKLRSDEPDARLCKTCCKQQEKRQG